MPKTKKRPASKPKTKPAAKKPTPPPAAPTNGHAAPAPDVETVDGTGPERDPILRRTLRLLPCKLTDPELLAISRKLGDALQDVSTETERQASQKKELSARLAGMQARVSELAAKLRRGEEDREIQVEVRADFKAGTAREVRLDTEAVLLTRELTATERQRPLFDAATVETEKAATNGATTNALQTGEPITEPKLCIECGGPIETTAVETCAGEGDLCDGGPLHPGCGGPHQDAHVAPDEVDLHDSPEDPDDETEDDEASGA